MYRDLNIRTAASLFAALGSPFPGEKLSWEPLWGDALIARARSIQATKWLLKYPDADVMVMIDDDVVFRTQDFWKLVEGARETHGIYSGAYLTHGENPHLACRILPGQIPDIKDGGQRRPIEIEYAATGFMAVHRDVIEAMVKGEWRDCDGVHKMHLCSKGAMESTYFFFDTMIIEEAAGQFTYLSEDFAFCERARQLGFKVYCDQSIMLTHMGQAGVSIDQFGGPDIGPASGWDTVQIEFPLSGEELLDKLPEEIAEFAGFPLSEVMATLPQATLALGELWENRSMSEEEWYKERPVGMAYACDLAWWHMHSGGVPLGLAKGLFGRSVLDFGAGIGTFSLAAAREGAVVTAWEVNPTLQDFISARAENRDLAINVAKEQPAAAEKFDVIVCWHVFEHVADPKGLLGRLSRSLNHKGVLITQSDFHCDVTHPQHHLFDGDWEEALKSFGFEKLGPDVYGLGALVTA